MLNEILFLVVIFLSNIIQCITGFAGTVLAMPFSVMLTKLRLEEIIASQSKDIINILDKKIDAVALALTNTATILNAKRIVLFGSVFSNETVVKKLKRQCIRYNGNLTDDMIILSKQNEKIRYIGPVAICAKKLFFESQ